MPVLGKVGLVNKGAYNAGTSYTALDFVKYNGSTFVALRGVQGIAPSDDGTNWSYLAQGVDVAVSNSQTVTTPGTALDAVQANKNINGSLAYNIDQEITSLNDSLSDTIDSLATKAEASSLSALQTSFDNYKTVNTGSQTATNTYGTVECYWRKVGNTVFMTVIFTPNQNLNTSSGALDISNAPAPLGEVLGATYDSTNATNNVGTVQFGAGKTMYFNGPRISGHSYHGSITYLCNS